MKTINPKLSKILNDKGLLKKIKTKYIYTNFDYYRDQYTRIKGLKILDKIELKENEIDIIKDEFKTVFGYYDNDREELKQVLSKSIILKTLTFEEAFDFLPDYIYYPKTHGEGHLFIEKNDNKYYVQYLTNRTSVPFLIQEGKTKIKAMEKMIEFLLDNDLL